MISMVPLEPTGFGGGAGGFGGSLTDLAFGRTEDILLSPLRWRFFANRNAPRQGDDLQHRVNPKFEEGYFW